MVNKSPWYSTSTFAHKSDSERKLHQPGYHNAFIIISPDQVQRKSGTELLKHRAFREEFPRFLIEELNKPHYWPIVGQYTYHMVVNVMKTNTGELLQTEVPNYLAGRHELWQREGNYGREKEYSDVSRR